MKKIILLIALIVGITSANILRSNRANFQHKNQTNRSWSLLFEDNFDGDKIDESKWTIAKNMTHTDQEQQIYYPKNAYVEDGNLVIKTEFEPTYYYPTNRTYNYTSAWLDTSKKFNFTCGTKIEARILLPKSGKGDQIWPAFWTLGETNWPDGGEIDVMEMSTNWYGDNMPHLYGTYHWGVNGTDYCGGCGTVFQNFNLNLSDWITFSAVWEQSQISWYINDQLYRINVQDVIYPNQSYPYPVKLPTFPQYLILNDAIDGSAIPDPSVYPKYMKVDYVRVYQMADYSSS